MAQCLQKGESVGQEVDPVNQAGSEGWRITQAQMMRGPLIPR